MVETTALEARNGKLESIKSREEINEHSQKIEDERTKRSIYKSGNEAT